MSPCYRPSGGYSHFPKDSDAAGMGHRLAASELPPPDRGGTELSGPPGSLHLQNDIPNACTPLSQQASQFFTCINSFNPQAHRWSRHYYQAHFADVDTEIESDDSTYGV